MKQSLLIIFFLTLFSCAHHKSGRYIYKEGKWVFYKSNIGLKYSELNFGKAQISKYDFDTVGQFIWPVPSSKKVSSHFGKRKGRHHDGIDIPARSGAAIVASADGVATVVGSMRGYGRVVVIKHSHGHHTIYAHNSINYIKKGQKVSQGEVIAAVGSSGRSTGPHLHFEIRRKNIKRNPAMYLARLKK